MTRRCHNDPTSFINFLDTTGTSRRHRTRRARAREASRERAEESAYLTELSIAQQLGHIARPTIQQPHERPFNDQEAHFEPQIGSYQDPEIDGNQEILPSAAHAAYFRSRRYAEHRERMSQRKLAAQREIVGNTGVADGLSVEQQDQLKMIWYLKTELRKSFLALVEEKQPLLRVCRAGDSSTLGTRGQQKLQEALRKRAGKLCTVLEKYNSHIEAFLVSNPNRPAPPIIEYCELLGLQPEDNFWNDGLFTNAHEPWAVDPLTQQGIRHLESYKRAVEEKRCLGWEVRRAMRWATKQNDDHLEILLALFELSRNPQEEVPTALQPLLRHQYLDHQSLESKIKSSLVVLHLGLIRICNLQLDWNRHIIGVIEGTEAQAGDTILVTKWISQVERIKYATTKGLLSQIPGELNEAAVRFLAGFEVINHPTDPSASSSNQNNSVPPTTPEGDINPRNEPSPSGRVTAESQESNGLAERNDLEDQSDEDAEGEEDTYLEDMEGILAETMQADLEQEHGVRIGQDHFVDQMMN
ncbi:hypothetical protein PtB15_2B395 [Puccinia triticina]|nr:hypothetical protein PtB15_2B395 [Puccinia triticina]